MQRTLKRLYAFASSIAVSNPLFCCVELCAFVNDDNLLSKNKRLHERDHFSGTLKSENHQCCRDVSMILGFTVSPNPDIFHNLFMVVYKYCLCEL